MEDPSHLRRARPIRLAPFVPPPFFVSPHLQTVSAALPFFAPPRDFRPAKVELLRFPLPCTGALHAHAWWHDAEARAAPTAVLVHGVGGSSRSRYVVRAAVSLHRAGWNVVRLDLRGAGESIGDAPELYHAGLTEDLAVAVRALASRREVQTLFLVGFSLGGHVVLRFAGEVGERPPHPLVGAVAISAPLDLTAVSRALERTRAAPYRAYVLRNLVRQARAFARVHPERAQFRASSLGRLRTVRAYDDAVIAPMHGFASAGDYYRLASAAPLVSHIRMATLVVHAEDDPLVPAESVRAGLAAASPAVQVAWSERGGHVGWVDGWSESSWVDTWAMKQTLAFLRACA